MAEDEATQVNRSRSCWAWGGSSLNFGLKGLGEPQEVECQHGAGCLVERFFCSTAGQVEVGTWGREGEQGGMRSHSPASPHERCVTGLKGAGGS